MSDELSVQWNPRQGPRRKLTFFPADDGSWYRIESVWDGQRWDELSLTEVEEPTFCVPEHDVDTDTNADPPTLGSLLDMIRDTWESDDPQVLVFAAPHRIVVAHLEGGLRYYSTQTRYWHPVDRRGLRGVVRQYGLPTVRSLAETRYNRTQFTGFRRDE